MNFASGISRTDLLQEWTVANLEEQSREDEGVHRPNVSPLPILFTFRSEGAGFLAQTFKSLAASRCTALVQ